MFKPSFPSQTGKLTPSTSQIAPKAYFETKCCSLVRKVKQKPAVNTSSLRLSIGRRLRLKPAKAKVHEANGTKQKLSIYTSKQTNE
ncbi:MAG: hypothetical protein ACTS5F_01020 [Candidatus Hodgkinia cicadicola]